MRYVCILCGAAGASAHSDKNPPHDYHCHVCPGEHTMWPAEKAESYRSMAEAYICANEKAYIRPLTLYLADGTEHKVQYSDELMSFAFGEMQIRNPQLSECGRFAAQPQQYGFEGWSSGGGCVVLRKNIEGRYFVLTDSSGCDLPNGDATDLLGLYTDDGDPMAIIRVGDIPFSE